MGGIPVRKTKGRFGRVGLNGDSTPVRKAKQARKDGTVRAINLDAQAAIRLPAPI